jgi:NADH dehydrogenase FAD-containing subunit
MPQPLIAEHGDGDSVIVDDYLRIKGRTNEYAIGDNASVVDPKTKEPAPLLAASAMQQGETAAENIARSLSGRRLTAFRHRNLTRDGCYGVLFILPG